MKSETYRKNVKDEQTQLHIKYPAKWVANV